MKRVVSAMVATAALAGIAATRAFFDRLGAPASLAYYNIGADKIPEMAEKCTRFGPVGNLRKLDAAEVEAGLRACL